MAETRKDVRRSIKKCGECKKPYWQATRTAKVTYCPDCLDGHMAKVRRKRSVHPNLKRSYFRTINTKDKAYWLGFLYADGFISATGTSFRVELKETDKHWIARMCRTIGADPRRIRLVVRRDGRRHSNISSPEIVSSLISLGCHNKKSLTITLPDLGKRSLDLAFLLGFFDGDGWANSTMICSGSRVFLAQIRKRYSLPYVLKKVKPKDPHNKCHAMSLGSPLFREMLKNYPNSLPRKRATHSGQVKWLKDRQLSSKVGQFDKSLQKLLARKKAEKKAREKAARKFDIPLREFKRLLRTQPVTQIAREHGVSDNAVLKRARLMGLKSMGRGYWNASNVRASKRAK